LSRRPAYFEALDGEADDPLMIALVLEEAERMPAPPLGVEPPGLLYEVKVATGWSDRKIGDTIGMSRATIQAVIGGRLAENVTGGQAKQLLAAMHRQRAALDRAIAKVRDKAQAE
jgi:hypothetical protein